MRSFVGPTDFYFSVPSFNVNFDRQLQHFLHLYQSNNVTKWTPSPKELRLVTSQGQNNVFRVEHPRSMTRIPHAGMRWHRSSGSIP